MIDVALFLKNKGALNIEDTVKDEKDMFSYLDISVDDSSDRAEIRIVFDHDNPKGN